MSPDPSPNETAPHGTEEGIALAFRAQDDGDWKPLVDWLARHPESAETVARFLGGERDVGRAVNPPRPAARVGTVLGEYELLEVLGRGQMGVVYRGLERHIGRQVAVKVIETSGLTEAARARVRFEVEALAGLDHKNVVPLFASGETDTELYFVMPLLAGGSLQGLIAGGHQLTFARVAELVRDIALGVHHAHQHGLLHRDLKPANVMLDAKSNPHVADFGLARPLDATVSMGGTPAYMAPEQARGERRLTTAVDVHALGVILFELLTGQRAFAGTDVPSTLKHVIEDPAPLARAMRPDVSKDLEAICLKCLEKEPSRRYSSAHELATDLQRFLDGGPVQARLPSIWGKAVRAVLWQQFDSPGAWGRLSVWCGALSAAFYLFCAWAISVDLPRWLLVTVTAVNALAVATVYWAILRHHRFRGGDRHSLIVQIVTVVAATLLPVLYRPAEGGDLTAYRLSVYPLLALIVGVSYLALAYPTWAGFYLVSAGYLVLAVLFKFFPPIGPWVFAVVHGGLMILVGVYLIRLDRAGDATGTHTNSRGNS